jgi:hypothetical protein
MNMHGPDLDACDCSYVRREYAHALIGQIGEILRGEHCTVDQRIRRVFLSPLINYA